MRKSNFNLILVLVLIVGGYYFYDSYILRPILFVDVDFIDAIETPGGWKGMYRGRVVNRGSKDAVGVKVHVNTVSLTIRGVFYPSAFGEVYIGTVRKDGGIETFEIEIYATSRYVFDYMFSYGWEPQ